MLESPNTEKQWESLPEDRRIKELSSKLKQAKYSQSREDRYATFQDKRRPQGQTVRSQSVEKIKLQTLGPGTADNPLSQSNSIFLAEIALTTIIIRIPLSQSNSIFLVKIALTTKIIRILPNLPAQDISR
jgi:hypothetical protein